MMADKPWHWVRYTREDYYSSFGDIGACIVCGEKVHSVRLCEEHLECYRNWRKNRGVIGFLRRLWKGLA